MLPTANILYVLMLYFISRIEELMLTVVTVVNKNDQNPGHFLSTE